MALLEAVKGIHPTGQQQQQQQQQMMPMQQQIVPMQPMVQQTPVMQAPTGQQGYQQQYAPPPMQQQQYGQNQQFPPERQYAPRKCYICDQAGHIASNCPKKVRWDEDDDEMDRMCREIEAKVPIDNAKVHPSESGNGGRVMEADGGMMDDVTTVSRGRVELRPHHRVRLRT